MIENVSIGLDIATALSVITAAFLFIWNSVNSSNKDKIQREKEKAQDRVERRKDIIQKQVFQIADRLADDVGKVNKEINQIYQDLSDGNTTQNLNPYRDLIQELPMIFRVRLVPLGKTYGDGRFVKLAQNFESEISDYILRLAELTSGESNEQWNFYDIMYIPLNITEKYIEKLMSEAESLIDSL